MANRDAMPTRGPVKIDRWGSVVDPCGDRLIVSGVALPSRETPEILANQHLIAAALNASTAARDLGFDAIGAIEALPLLIEACRKANSCASLPDAVKQLCREAVSAARKRGDA